MWTKQPFTKLDTGWLSPSGDWYPCEFMEHLALAGYLCEDKEVSDRYAEEELLKTGWCEVQVMTLWSTASCSISRGTLRLNRCGLSSL